MAKRFGLNARNVGKAFSGAKSYVSNRRRERAAAAELRYVLAQPRNIGRTMRLMAARRLAIKYGLPVNFLSSYL